MSFIRIDQVSKKYDSANALKRISFDIKEGEKIAIVGETGSGKSTLLKLIGGLLEADAGQVLYQGEKIVGPSDKLIPGHPDIIYLSQHFELPKFITVREHLDNPYLIGEEDAKQIYTSCQIEHLLEKDTRHLSGGEKQRVAIAKALTNLPSVILLDEPFSNLDSLHKEIIKDVLRDIEANWETTIVMVSHEPKDVLPWADRIKVLKQGEIIQSGTPKDIYSNPINEYVAGLFGKYNLIDHNLHGLNKINTLPKIGEKVLIRPEQIQLSTETNGSDVKGVIQSIQFHGNHHLIVVKTDHDNLLIESPFGKYSIEHQVYISFKP